VRRLGNISEARFRRRSGVQSAVCPVCGRVETLRAWAEWFDRLLGLHVEVSDLHFSHMAWRCVVVFCMAIALARLADRRFMGRNACFDFMLGVILGSVLSRGINGQAPFFPTLGACALLVLLHRLIGTATFHSHRFSEWVKGREYLLIRDGKIDGRAMRRNNITYDDLCEDLRLNGNINNVAEVAEARLERNGNISIIKAKGAP
jgi:uncharacterized membrane protein YcaP (DUF421 family)